MLKVAWQYIVSEFHLYTRGARRQLKEKTKDIVQKANRDKTVLFLVKYIGYFCGFTTQKYQLIDVSVRV